MSEKILIVEDSPELVEMIRLCLQKKGYEVFAAYDGDQAIKTIHKHAPDLVILDMGLPKKSGLDVFREITTRFGHLKIPVLVASAHDEMKDLLDEIEVDGFVSKPYELGDLVRKVEEILSRRDKPNVFLVDFKGSVHSRKIMDVLEKERYAVAIVEDLCDFKRLAALYTPRVILMEYVRQEMTGSDFIRIMNQIMQEAWGRRAPVLVYSYSGLDYLKKSVEAGAAKYLGLPNGDYEFFIHAIREFELQKKQEIREHAA